MRYWLGFLMLSAIAAPAHAQAAPRLLSTDWRTGDSLPPLPLGALLAPIGNGKPTIGPLDRRLNDPGTGFTLIEFSGYPCRECLTSIDSVVHLSRRLPATIRQVTVWVHAHAPTVWKLYAAHRPLPFTVYLDPSDWREPRKVQLPLPSMVLVDSRGRILRLAVGEAEILPLLTTLGAHGLDAVLGDAEARGEDM